jgi:YD repeat-containing protein
VTKKVTPTEVTDLSYDAKAAKVSKVVRNSKIDKKLSSWSEFKYDERGNLVLAKNSEKKGVKLFYDTNGRIKSLIDQDQRRLDFKYNENSKPVEITDPKLGTIRVSYKNSGEIDKIDSSAGQKVALQVTSAFQNLLEIIRPAGVNLSF